MLNNMNKRAKITGLGDLINNCGFVYPAEAARYVDENEGLTTNDGLSFATAFTTVTAALNDLKNKSVDHPYIFIRGDLNESVITPLLSELNKVTIVGTSGGSNDHATQWRSDDADKPALTVKGAGYRFLNIKFRSYASTTVETVKLQWDATAHGALTEFDNCMFYGGYAAGGPGALNFYGAPYDCVVQNCYFEGYTNAGTDAKAIYCSNTPTAVPFRCRFLNNTFLECDRFIDIWQGTNSCVFMGNIFQGTGQSYANGYKLNLGGAFGTANMVCGNYMGGTYAAGTDYKESGGTDDWNGNFCDVATTGLSRAVPV